jgi:hypothetical protein
MFRKRTEALKTLKLDLKRPARLLQIEKSQFNDPPQTSRQRIGVEGLRSGAIVLMAATLEAYLKDVFVEVVDAMELRRAANKTVVLTPAFLQANDFDGLEAILRDQIGDKTSRHADLRRVAKAVAARELVGDGFARTEANPRPEVVSRMLKRFGVSEPFKTLASGAATRGWTYSENFLRAKLDEILDRRNEVAHQGVSLNVTRTQLQEYVSFIDDLATLIDEAIVTHYRLLCA